MNDTLLVSELQPARRLNDAPHHLLDRQRPVFLDQHRQVISFDVFHDQEVRPLGLVRIESRDDVRMRELRRRLDLAMKPLERIGRFHRRRRHDLERDQPLHPLVLSLEHHPHPALSQFVEDDVVAQRQRIPFARVKLLGLKLGELLLLDQFASQLFAVGRLLIRRQARKRFLDDGRVHQAAGGQLLDELVA